MINEVRLMGRLARDPKLVEFNNGGAACNLRVITSRSWKNPTTGEFDQSIEGHSVVVYVTPIARRAATTLKKGSLVYIAGLLETRKWVGQDDVTRYSTEVVIRPYNGTLRRLPQNVTGSAPTPEGQGADDVEIDYMAEMSSLDTVSLDGNDPFS